MAIIKDEKKNKLMAPRAFNKSYSSGAKRLITAHISGLQATRNQSEMEEKKGDTFVFQLLALLPALLDR